MMEMDGTSGHVRGTAIGTELPS